MKGKMDQQKSHNLNKNNEKIEKKINRISGTCEITSECLTERENRAGKKF